MYQCLAPIVSKNFRCSSSCRVKKLSFHSLPHRVFPFVARRVCQIVVKNKENSPSPLTTPPPYRPPTHPSLPGGLLLDSALSPTPHSRSKFMKFGSSLIELRVLFAAQDNMQTLLVLNRPKLLGV